MEYAVIKTSGKQYKVTPGQILTLDNLSLKPGEVISFNDVLLFVSDGQINIGKPTVLGVKVTGKVLASKKGEKIHVSKFKSKVRYRRVMGFRALLTDVQIEKIESGLKEPKKPETLEKPIKTAPKSPKKTTTKKLV